MKVHLTGQHQATACGQCAAWGVPETHDPTKVTCARCKATAWFKLRASYTAEGMVIDLMVALADSLKQSKVSAGETETRT